MGPALAAGPRRPGRAQPTSKSSTRDCTTPATQHGEPQAEVITSTQAAALRLPCHGDPAVSLPVPQASLSGLSPVTGPAHFLPVARYL